MTAMVTRLDPFATAPAPIARTGDRPPPRFVPTLTEVVALEPSAPQTNALEPEPVSTQQEPPVVDEELILRVLQRVESDLQRRLGPMIERAVQKQAASMAQGLVEAVEPLVRASISEAVAAEWQADPCVSP